MENPRDGHGDNVLQVNFEKSAQSAEQKGQSIKKRELFEQWLNKGMVTLLLDARCIGVKVPPEFGNQGDLRLNFSYGFRITDFNFDNSAVWATLSFDSGYFLCHVPWASVYGLQSQVLNQGAVWFRDFPSDYDQASVLGFGEDSIDPLEEIVEDSFEGNVIEYDFTKKKDLEK